MSLTLRTETQTVHLEHQWDPAGATIVLAATQGRDREYGDRYAVTRPAATQDDADRAWRSWIGLYRRALGLVGEGQ